MFFSFRVCGLVMVMIPSVSVHEIVAAVDTSFGARAVAATAGGSPQAFSGTLQ